MSVTQPLKRIAIIQEFVKLARSIGVNVESIKYFENESANVYKDLKEAQKKSEKTKAQLKRKRLEAKMMRKQFEKLKKQLEEANLKNELKLIYGSEDVSFDVIAEKEYAKVHAENHVEKTRKELSALKPDDALYYYGTKQHLIEIYILFENDALAINNKGEPFNYSSSCVIQYAGNSYLVKPEILDKQRVVVTRIK